MIEDSMVVSIPQNTMYARMKLSLSSVEFQIAFINVIYAGPK
jgi:hypothetical protein